MMLQENPRIRKFLLHPVVVVASPIVLTITILFVLHFFGQNYRQMPFFYTFF
jgi:hypothetical protein